MRGPKITREELREWEKELFPIEVIGKKLDSPDDIDEEYIDYCLGVWCCNSLNAVEGIFRYKNPNSIRKVLIDGEYYPIVSYKECESAALMLARAQNVIHYLRAKVAILEEEK